MDVYFGHGMSRYDSAIRKNLIDYFQGVEIEGFNKVLILDCNYQSPTIEHKENTLYVLNNDLPLCMSDFKSQCLDAPSIELLYENYVYSDQHDVVFSLCDYEGCKVIFVTLDDSDSIPIAIRDSDSLYITRPVLASSYYAEFFDLVLDKLFSVVKRINWDTLSEPDKLKFFYDTSQLSPMGNKRLLLIEIDALRVKKKELEEKLESLNEVYRDLRDELDTFEDLHTTFDYDDILRSLLSISKVKSIDFNSNGFEIEIGDLKLGYINLPTYVITVDTELNVEIRAKDLNMIHDHPHLNVDNKPCWGNLANYAHSVLMDLDLVSLVNLIVRFLQSYDEVNPYVELYLWVKELAYQYVKSGMIDLAKQVVQSWNCMLHQHHGLPIKIDGSLEVSEASTDELLRYCIDLDN